MTSRSDLQALLGNHSTDGEQPVPSLARAVQPIVQREARLPQPRRFKKSALLRTRARTAHWTSRDSTPATRSDQLRLRRWHRNAPGSTEEDDSVKPDRFAKYNVHPDVPHYDDDTYERHLTNEDWSRNDTDVLVELYRDCSGKWPVIADHFEGEAGTERSMEELKARFYSISATLLSLRTPITSMTAPEYNLYEILNSFDPRKEASRKKLAEGHLYRPKDQVDEETVLLNELQRIMVNQANLDSEREDLRRRLDHPQANTGGYQYSSSQALTQLWQQLLAADRLKKTTRLKPTGNPSFDGFSSATPTSARPRESNAGMSDLNTMPGRRPTRDSLPSATTSHSALPVDLTNAELSRFGVVQAQDKLPSGITFASDKLSKPRVAKSTVQTDKIAAILAHIGVPELIPLPTPTVVEQFDAIMGKVHALLDMRKLAEKEEQELRVRQAEKGSS